MRRYLFPVLGFATFAAIVMFINAMIDTANYPFNVWRMDLDDFVANIAIVAGAVAGIWKVHGDAKRAEQKADTLEEKLNGGMKEAARSHMQDNELFQSLMFRVDRMEQERNECQDALSDLRVWVIQRLDDSGNGRNIER